MSKYRGHGEGGLTERKDGRWQLTATTLGGRRVYRYFRGTKQDAQDVLGRLNAEVRAGGDPTGLTLGVYLRGWLNDQRPSLRPSTSRTYRMIVDRYLVPNLGSHRLGRLTALHIVRYLAERRKTLAPRTVHHHHALLRAALEDAVQYGLIPSNPAKKVQPPTVPHVDRPTLSPETARAFLDSLESDPMEALFKVALGTGVRQGELLGLAWEDVDLEAGTITIRRTLVRTEGQWRTGEPKSRRSKRTLALPAFALDALRRRRATLDGHPLPDHSYIGLVFTTASGTPYHGSEVTKALRVRLARAGIIPIRFHDLRHTAASLMLHAGVDLRVIQEALGHSTITLTANTYSHVSRGLSEAAATRLDDVLRR